MSSFWAAISTASEIAMPSEPVSCCGVRAPGLRQLRGRAVHRRAPGLHHRAPVGLLVVRGADHEDLALQAEHAARERQRRAPLPGARLRRDLADAGLRVLVRLRDRGVRLVRARRARRPRTCSRCAPAYRAPAPGGARGRAASGARACRPRAPPRGSRSPARRRPPAGSATRGRSPAGPAGPAGSFVCGFSGGSGSPGRSAIRLTQCVGIRSSVSRNFVVWSDMVRSYSRPDPVQSVNYRLRSGIAHLP